MQESIGSQESDMTEQLNQMEIDFNPPGSSVNWIFQAKILEWVAVPSSMGSSRPRNQS